MRYYQSELDKLMEEEERTKAEVQSEKNVIKESFAKGYDLLRIAIEEHKKSHDAEINKIRGSLNLVCDEMEKIDWEINSIEHQLQGYRSITFAYM